MKVLLFGIVAFVALAVRADVVPGIDEMFNPALHRIGFEVIVCTAASADGIDESDSTWYIVIDGRGSFPLPADRPFLIGQDVWVTNPDAAAMELIATSNGLKALVLGKDGVVVDGKRFVGNDVVVLSKGSEIWVGTQLKIIVGKALVSDAASLTERES